MIKTLGSHASEVSLGAAQNVLGAAQNTLGAAQSVLGAAQNTLFLGLRVVSGSSDARDGEVEPDVRAGSTLRSMPAGATATRGLEPTASDPVHTGSEPTSRPVLAAHVLVCDDETRLGDLTAGLLEECGFAAGFVPSAVEAMAYLETHDDTRVLLLDVNLSGGKSAQDLLAFLLTRSQRVRVVLTSGSSKQEVRSELTQHPFVVGYLEKPYAEEELTAAITSALAVD